MSATANSPMSDSVSWLPADTSHRSPSSTAPEGAPIGSLWLGLEVLSSELPDGVARYFGAFFDLGTGGSSSHTSTPYATASLYRAPNVGTRSSVS
jgi:hypothetical protein